MQIFRLLFLTLFIGCAGPGRQMLVLMPKKSYSEYLQEFSSCTGKGMIDSNGPFKGKLSFTFKSQRDSTFLQFGDALGRKALLMWITPNSVTARNLIENKQYDYGEILEFFPLFNVLEPNDITQFVWGVEPKFKDKFKSIDPSKTKNFELNFLSDQLINEKRALVEAKFHDRESKQAININIKSRNRNSDYVNLKKVWKLLKY
tara:strand:- start:510 stop:1118 length:609 start_codon:yes stop_codon:yes gene_type:complete